MAESLPPESDNKKSDADDEELVQIGAHSTVFPPPEEAPVIPGSVAGTGATAVAGATAEAQTAEHNEMNTDQTTKTPAATARSIAACIIRSALRDPNDIDNTSAPAPISDVAASDARATSLNESM